MKRYLTSTIFFKYHYLFSLLDVMYSSSNACTFSTNYSIGRVTLLLKAHKLVTFYVISVSKEHTTTLILSRSRWRWLVGCRDANALSMTSQITLYSKVIGNTCYDKQYCCVCVMYACICMTSKIFVKCESYFCINKIELINYCFNFF